MRIFRRRDFVQQYRQYNLYRNFGPGLDANSVIDSLTWRIRFGWTIGEKLCRADYDWRLRPAFPTDPSNISKN